MAGDLQLQRDVLRWGFYLALVTGLVLLGLVLSGEVERSFLAFSGGVAVLFGWQLRSKTPRAAPALLAVAVALGGGGSMFFSGETVPVGATALVVLLLGAVLLSSGPSLVQAVMGVALIAVAVWWWQPSLGQTAIFALLSAEASFLLGYGVIAAVFESRRRSATRYQALYSKAPVGLIEEDWGAALQLLSSRLRPGETVRSRITSDHQLLEEVLAAVEVVEVNDEAARIEGRSKEEMIGPLRALLRGDLDVEWWVDGITAVSQGRATSPSRIRATSVQGEEQWLQIEALVIEAPSNVLVTINDVTEVEKARLDLERESVSKDRFIAAVSHELRTPLAAIVGFSHLLTSDRSLDPEEADEMMQFIAEEANQVAWVVEDLLVTARADSGLLTVRPAATDLMAELETVMRDIPGVALEGEIPGWGAVADGGRLRHIIRNLLLNAVEHGGPERKAVVSVARELLTLEVRDSGPPLPDEDVARIFSPYESAHNRPGLTASVGLGLAVARRLAQLMNGDLDYFHDGETVFRLTLPAIPLSSAGTRSVPSPLVISVEPERTDRV